MAADETASITVRVTPLQQGNVRARATVQGAEPDPDTADNTSSALTTAQAAADFSVALTDTPDPVGVRDQLTYRAEVANDGPSNGAANLSATLPTEVRLVSVTASGGGDCRVDRKTVICFFAGIDPGQRVAAAIATSPKQAGLLTASASVSPFLVTDPVAGNNTRRRPRSCGRRPRQCENGYRSAFEPTIRDARRRSTARAASRSRRRGRVREAGRRRSRADAQQRPPELAIDVGTVLAGRSACAGSVVWTEKPGSMVASRETSSPARRPEHGDEHGTEAGGDREERPVDANWKDETGATGLEPATSGVTSRYCATGHGRLRPGITLQRASLAERTGRRMRSVCVTCSQKGREAGE
jgi:Domain of unknown function DUF11